MPNFDQSAWEQSREEESPTAIPEEVLHTMRDIWASRRQCPARPIEEKSSWEQQRDEVAAEGRKMAARDFRHLILPIEDRMRILLSLIAKDLRPCRDCGEMIAVVKHRSGRSWPYSLDGVNHKMHCPKRGVQAEEEL